MIFKDIWLDIKAVQERDPAARSALEVLDGIHYVKILARE